MPLCFSPPVPIFLPGFRQLPCFSSSCTALCLRSSSLLQRKQRERASFPLSVVHLPPPVTLSRGKSVRMALCEAVQAAPWSSAKHSIKAKVCPEV
ncbi:hypothetical protein KUCAC02_013547 [Chaenocephalus aceratus]|uniref:Uncharacterized protein n=1 Tax=Chaenocephalus aceratus TaxID=36190 RepID=A0ACB9WB49_CHAAC|nr:hypothetical protein KUCAC02_013547 [Chaenocephalus aceratus]